MSEFKFRDYDVCVWNGDVFIDSHDVIAYASGSIGRGLQINTCSEYQYEDIMNLCNSIACKFEKLDMILNDIEKLNKKKNEKYES